MDIQSVMVGVRECGCQCIVNVWEQCPVQMCSASYVNGCCVVCRHVMCVL